MKILFICKSNVARSKMSEEIFNKLSKDHTAISAGLNPGDWEGKKVGISQYASVVKEIGYNIDNKISKKITNEMVNQAGKIIVIGEKDNWPEYLKDNNHVEFWDIEDPGKKDINGKEDIKTNIKVRDELLPKIKELVNRLS